MYINHDIPCCVISDMTNVFLASFVQDIFLSIYFSNICDLCSSLKLKEKKTYFIVIQNNHEMYLIILYVPLDL
jgi:hypothetical protein